MSQVALPPALSAEVDRVVLRNPVFISDLHLNAAQPATVDRFARFAQDIAPRFDELVILGDLFEYWIGDDAVDPVGRRVIAALEALSASGRRVYLMHGNRDLLIGRRFCEMAGATLLADPCLASIRGVATLLAHGDAYCTLDADYMRFRSQVRDPHFQQMFLAKTPPERIAFVTQARAASESGKAAKDMQIMDVTPEEIRKALRTAGVQRMIHGHTHRPATHTLQMEAGPAQRWVLPDWDADASPPRGGYLQTVEGGAWQVVPF